MFESLLLIFKGFAFYGFFLSLYLGFRPTKAKKKGQQVESLTSNFLKK